MTLGSIWWQRQQRVSAFRSAPAPPISSTDGGHFVERCAARRDLSKSSPTGNNFFWIARRKNLQPLDLMKRRTKTYKAH
jgi:hypothetical protein